MSLRDDFNENRHKIVMKKEHYSMTDSATFQMIIEVYGDAIFNNATNEAAELEIGKKVKKIMSDYYTPNADL